MPYRIVALWSNGAFVNSDSDTFKQDLNDLIAQFGIPNAIVLRALDSDQDIPLLD